MNNPNQLIFLNRYFYPDQSATSQLLTDLAFELAPDYPIHIITSRQRYDDPAAQLPSFEVVNQVHIHRVWTSQFGRQHLLGRALDYLSFYFTAAWQLWRLARTGDIIIAKTDPPLLSNIAAPIAKWHKAILINWLQDIFPEVAAALGISIIRGRLLRVLQRWRNGSLLTAQYNIALGSLMATYLQHQGVPPTQITVIPNWADGKTIYPLSATNHPLRREWQLQNKFIVGYSGNLGRAHEFITILDAAEQLIHDENIIFLFIGNGPQRQWLEQEVNRRHLTHVLFKPYQPRERLSESLTVPDIHLISLHPDLEGLIVPSKFYGIAAAGRPVLYVGDMDGEIPCLLREYECGLAVATGDSKTLVAHLKWLTAHAEECLQMGERIRKLFEQTFEKSLALAKWRKILDECKFLK